MTGSKQTAQTILDTIHATLQTTFAICLHSPSFHPLGPINIIDTKEQIGENAAKLRKIIEIFRYWSTMHKEVLVNRHLKLLKDQSKSSSISNYLQNNLNMCLQLGSMHLQQSKGTDFKREILLQLKDMSLRLGLQYFVDETVEPASGALSTTVSLSSPTLLIDVVVDETGKQATVTLTSSDENSNTQFDEELTKSLKTNFQSFESKIKFLHCKHQLLSTATGNLRSVLKCVENDLVDIHKYESSTSSFENCRRSMHGIMRNSWEGLYLDYFPPTHGENFALLLTAEKSASPPVLQSSSAVTWDESKKLNLLAPVPGEQLPYQLVFLSGTPIPITKHILKILASLTQTTDETFLDTQRQNETTPIQNLLVRDKLTTETFVFNGKSVEGFLLERVPFSHVSQVQNILQVLRQQVTFNSLFRSCFLKNDHFNLQQVIEITTNPPFSIAATCIHPKASSLICVQVSILLNGEMRLSILPENAFDAQEITRILKESLSLPLIVNTILHGIDS